MTEPKKQKCEACCGSGYINFRTDDGHISMRTCRRCDGYGYINVEPLTNEEYIRQCSTEQLVHFLIRLCSCGWLTKDKLDVFLNSTYFPVYNMEEIANLEEWLKEKHND